ncbi:MAG: AarF/ABC1/UbiB kinase family protein [Deltaproteobacteria bacterium]|nr:AarF/ABC1/UbiB kinase family protein [Deltaproteobacteria bacterium]
MNWIGFVRLMRSIFGSELPDLQKIQDQGLLAVKIAQVFALRIDFLNREKCQHLARLYRHTVEIPAEDMRRLLAQYTDESFAARFESINDAALASASVGQVHRARLKGGAEVIVKLIKKECKKQFVRDVRSIKRLFQLAIMFYPKLQKVADPVGILENIEDYTLTELNLLNEIKGQDILKNIYLENRDRFDLSHLKFAELYRDLSNENVLVAEFIDGKTFDELLEEGRMPYDQLLELFRMHGFYMFVSGTFHGDIHPGNIILKDGDLYFVDTSAISHTGPKIRRGLFDFFTALAYWDYGECAVCLNRMAEKGITGRQFDAFREKFVALYADFKETTVSQVSLTQRMMETIKLGVHNGMVFERGIFAIIKSLMYLDGMVLRCNPDAVLMRDMRPFIGQTRAMMDAVLSDAPHR